MSEYFTRLLAPIRRDDVFLVGVLATATTILFYVLFGQHDQTLVTGGSNVWFQGDLPRVFSSMTDRTAGGHYRVKVHPLFSLETFPPAYALTKLGVGGFTAVRIVTAATAGLWMLAMYALLRVAGCLRFDAGLFSVLGICSSAGMFWLSVPESYALGSISIMAGLMLAALASRQELPAWAYVTVSAFTLSVTVTNWMVGILSTVFGNPWRRAVLISLIALASVTLLWGVEKYIFRNAVFFIGDGEERAYTFFPTVGRIASVFASFLFHTMLTPALNVAGDNGFGWPLLSIQTSRPGSSGMLGLIGVALWTPLLALGIWGLISLKTLGTLRSVLGLSLLGQIGLHTLYGEETFLYSLHFLPLLVALAALATRTRLRTPAIALAILLVPVAAAGNWLQLVKADAIAVSPREEVRRQMQARPQDPWPRGVGHVVLARPGSLEQDKAYHEPGGSFSPGVGTFGISVWVRDHAGNPVTTSDTIPMEQLTQRLDWDDKRDLPQLKTSTRYYETNWRSDGWDAWKLELTVPDHVSLSPALMIRSVGPAGGAIRDLTWNGETLLVNKRWSLAISPLPKAVHLGDEGAPDWKMSKGTATTLHSLSGWGFARIELSAGTTWTAKVVPEYSADEPDLSTSIASTILKVSLPDERFAHSLDAQVAHMTMGLVGRETRPGDPTSYPLAWQRDGAYVLVALARVGNLEAAKALATDFAKRDFFGGFGPEADAPGLGLWALGTVANQVREQDFDRWLWPSIHRKATYIESMLTTRSSLRQPVVGPIVPRYINDPEKTLVAEPAAGGLIVGRMDRQRPLLFVNAVSYRGLLEAAALASRLGHADEEKRWTATAERIKAAWEKAFKPPQSNNDRTYISALWPSWVATEKRDELQRSLDERWATRRDADGRYRKPPLWTYFELAEAHQWLFLGRGDRVWSTCDWFWSHQSSPGLYTWWEGNGEENSFGKWENVRGWVRPSGVTPHYWTAAEMALLQLDMLAYVDEGSTDKALVVGAGIPPQWISHAMRVQGLRVGTMVADWAWDGTTMKVLVHGKKPSRVKLGTSFPTDAKIEVSEAID